MKPLQDYSFLKGVNHGFERDEAALRRHLGYGKRLGINSVRIWLLGGQHGQLHRRVREK